MSDLLLNVDNDYLDLAAALNIDISTITDTIDINTSKSQLSRAKKHIQRELLGMSKINL